jgi:hypothetical protein
MVAKEIGVNLNIKPVDLAAGEHMKPEFLKVRVGHVFVASLTFHVANHRLTRNTLFRPWSITQTIWFCPSPEP